MCKNRYILWADDEIEMLKPHIIYLESKGYTVIAVNSGEDAIQICSKNKIDIVLLDEMMVGLDGLTTLKEIKNLYPSLPVIMITKNEEEWLMEEAIAAQISQYLTKPVNPSQILMACKNTLDSNQIKSEHIAKDYLKSFEEMSQNIYKASEIEDWYKILDELIAWSINFDNLGDQGLGRMLKDQWGESNVRFTNYIQENYFQWIKGNNSPLLSTEILNEFILPSANNGEKIIFIVMDCLRADQFQALEPQLYDHFNIQKDYYVSILPTATPYSRNAIFSGCFPNVLQQKYPEMWKEMWNNEFSMNQYEEYFLKNFFKEKGLNHKSISYHKIVNYKEGNKFAKRIKEYKEIDVLSLVVNFVDILGHSRSEYKILEEMVPDESAYRKAICSWIENAWFMEVLKEISSWDAKIIITSDHGSIQVDKPIRVKGDRETSSGVRYKYGRNLDVSSKGGIRITNPNEYNLPNHGFNTDYIIAKGKNYFVYPNEYNKYVKKYNNSFQHGGISLEEMLIPIASLKGKK